MEEQRRKAMKQMALYNQLLNSALSDAFDSSYLKTAAFST